MLRQGVAPLSDVRKYLILVEQVYLKEQHSEMRESCLLLHNITITSVIQGNLLICVSTVIRKKSKKKVLSLHYLSIYYKDEKITHTFVIAFKYGMQKIYIKNKDEYHLLYPYI